MKLIKSEQRRRKPAQLLRRSSNQKPSDACVLVRRQSLVLTTHCRISCIHNSMPRITVDRCARKILYIRGRLCLEYFRSSISMKHERKDECRVPTSRATQVFILTSKVPSTVPGGGILFSALAHLAVPQSLSERR